MEFVKVKVDFLDLALKVGFIKAVVTLISTLTVKINHL